MIPCAYVRENFMCINSEVGMLERNVNLSSALVDIANLLSEEVVSDNIFINSMQEFLFLYILQTWYCHMFEALSF